jgi:sugar lactone lactonase YvrE
MGMSAKKASGTAASSVLLLILILLLGHSAAAAVKLKVTTEGSTIYAAASISSQKLANVALKKILDYEGQQGDFYKVTLDQGGVKITGYIYKEYVEEVSESEAEKLSKQAAVPGEMVKTQEEIVALLDNKIEENKDLIRLQKDSARAVENLRPLIAKIFSLEDRQKQKQVACNIYYWLGVALAQQNEYYSATKEFRNMFEVDTGFAAEATKNVPDSLISKLVDNAEKQYKGLLVEYTLNVATEPKEATVKIDGKVIGRSPVSHSTKIPTLILDIEKEGYKPVRDSIFLTDAVTPKNYALQSTGRTVKVASTPAGARVFLDGQDTGKVTDCELPYVAYGPHTLKMASENYADWEQAFPLVEGPDAFPISAMLTIRTYAPFRAWGGATSKSFKLPKAIAVDTFGNIYVADGSDYKVRKYDSEFRTLSWSDSGLTIRKLDTPAGIAFDSQGFLWITDSANACVARFDRNGKQVAKWGRLGIKTGELNGPTGIAVDRNNDIFVADTGNNRINRYSAAGVVKKAWGKQGTGPGEFVSPSGIAVTSKNEIIVIDKGGRVQFFSSDGVFISEFGRSGSGDGELSRPLGLCLDEDGFIYVADTGNHRIQKFAPEGKLIAKLGGSGSPGSLLSGPAGVAVNQKGAIFVVERDSHRIQEFRVPSKTP